MILPGFGIVSEIIPAFSRKKMFGYKFVVWASISIAVIGFFVWGHHMFVAGMSIYSAVVFSLLSYIVAVPSRDQGVQLAGHACTRATSASTRRCSTRWASSACSPSAA